MFIVYGVIENIAKGKSPIIFMLLLLKVNKNFIVKNDKK
jgi:hypothetical protein